MACMRETDIKQRVKGERLRLAANMCQTLAIGIVLIAVLTPLLAGQGPDVKSSWINAAGASVVAVVLFIYAHVLIGLAVRSEA